jgi:hypothetical protein
MGRHDHQDDVASASATLRHRLDRAVVVAKAARLLGWLGRVAVVAVAALLGAAAVGTLIAPAGMLSGRWPVVAVVVAGAVAAWWRWAGQAPTRLDVARASEASHAELGERISRAVAFLDVPTDVTQEPPLTRGLRELAIEDAARAGEVIRRLPVPGLRLHAAWAAAGSVAVIAWLTFTGMMPHDSSAGRLGEVPSLDAPVVAPEVDHSQAAARLAAVAAVESRLAEILALRFAAAPGQTVDSLPGEQQRDLVRLAEIHAESQRAVHRIRSELATKDTPAAQAAVQQLGPFDDASGDTIGRIITVNRLASAAAGARQCADTLTAVVRLLGGEETRGDVAMPYLTPREVVRVRRAEATLADIEQRPLDGRQAAAERRTAVATARREADHDSRPIEAGRSAGPPGAEQAGDVTEAPTSEPRFAAGDANISRPLDEAASPQARVWSLLPAASRPFARSGAEPDVPADYRAAVDLYYQVVLESLPSEPVARREP